MKTLTIVAIACLLGTAFSAIAAEPVPQKRGLLTHKPHHVLRQTRQIQKQQPADEQPEKPAVTRLPVPPDTFRA
jgi:hypothetical protein